jgi:hypothetical protein
MTTIVNTIKIVGPAEAIFDLVTTAGFWPEWHPACFAVGGVTRRPYRLGEKVWEKGRLAQSEFLLTWKVVEHEPPMRTVLDSPAPRARITYDFRSCDDGVEFSRSVEYDEADLHAVAADPRALREFMQQQSAEALERLKALVEGILRDEGTGPA